MQHGLTCRKSTWISWRTRSACRAVVGSLRDEICSEHVGSVWGSNSRYGRVFTTEKKWTMCLTPYVANESKIWAMMLRLVFPDTRMTSHSSMETWWGGVLLFFFYNGVHGQHRLLLSTQFFPSVKFQNGYVDSRASFYIKISRKWVRFKFWVNGSFINTKKL